MLNTRKRGRPRSGDESAISRDTLLQNALASFAAAGFQGFSARDLSRRLGVSHGLIHIRFGNKEQLWDECVRWGIGRIRDEMEHAKKNAPIEERLRQTIIFMLLAIEAVPELLKLVNFEAANEGERMSGLLDAHVDEGCAILEALVEQGVREGVFRDVPANLIFLFVAHGGGTVFALKPLSERLDLLRTGTRKEIRARAAEIADFVIRGLKV